MPTICVVTHRDPSVVASSIPTLIEAAREHGVQLYTTQEEGEKHHLLRKIAVETAAIGWEKALAGADYSLVLAGDGTLLRLLAESPDAAPVLGVNYGIMGYLSATPRSQLRNIIGALARNEVDIVHLPAITAKVGGNRIHAVNDVVASGGVTGGIIELRWRIVRNAGTDREHIDDMGVVPCDGMVLSTAVGSTAYNLSNGGPVVAWGVNGCVVSFIAPHTLTARPLLVATADQVEIEHTGRGAPLKLYRDGRKAGKLRQGEKIRLSVVGDYARLAVPPDVSFYARYRDLFAIDTQRFDPDKIEVIDEEVRTS